MGHHQIIKKRGVLLPYFVLFIDPTFFIELILDRRHRGELALNLGLIWASKAGWLVCGAELSESRLIIGTSIWNFKTY